MAKQKMVWYGMERVTESEYAILIEEEREFMAREAERAEMDAIEAEREAAHKAGDRWGCGCYQCNCELHATGQLDMDREY